MSELAAKLKKYRLSRAEYDRVVELLNRPPEGVEWALFSALWSEHCSYKSSRVHLRKFSYRSERVLQSMGENAGVVDLGKGEKVAFKMESHNHPSFIEPYQGAATGVGGILRDIFTMGAKPVALANYLCFGRPDAERMSTLVDGVVAGIAGYGNCVGVPNITGQTEFHSSYDSNILVNALAVGYFGPEDPIVTSVAKGIGNFVVYVGAKTGRDGVHGASMASESFGSDSASKRPTVQIGDPFYEKLLIESCIEVIKKGLVVAIQDMGAAGLTSSSFEMAAKGGVGFRLHLDRVPLRDSSLGPEEILLSESQERMLLVCEPDKFKQLQAVFHHWSLDAQILGEVIKGPEVELFWKNEKICQIDPNLLTDNAPLYERFYHPWQPVRKAATVKSEELDFETVLGSPDGCSRRWIFQQYDQRVGAQTVKDCEEPVAAIRLPHSNRALGLVLGCRPYLMRLDAQLGGQDAAMAPALELSSKGFLPLALTDCLNFGNPEKPEIMTDFVAAVEGLAECAKFFDIPVISGNVSFYNETMGVNITSTPATGMVGLRESLAGIPASQFQRAGDAIYLWRLPMVHFIGDQLKRDAHFSGHLDMARLARWMRGLRKATEGNTSMATRLVGKFGLAYSLFRMCTDKLGAKIDVKDLDLWSETLYEVLFVGEDQSLKTLLEGQTATFGGELKRLGQVAPGGLDLGGRQHDLSKLRKMYEDGWRRNFAELA
ncbi:MAG: phosphoribosylformylglycinamidine synthase subunit PurL [Bdellovibrionales bacterium]